MAGSTTTKDYEGPSWWWSPGRWRGALGQVVDEAKLLARRVAADPSIDPTTRGAWYEFLGRFEVWLEGLGASDVVFSGSSSDEIQMWHERLVQWHARLRAAGATTLDPSDIQDIPRGQRPLEGLEETAESVATIAAVGGVLVLGGLAAYYFSKRSS